MLQKYQNTIAVFYPSPNVSNPSHNPGRKMRDKGVRRVESRVNR